MSWEIEEFFKSQPIWEDLKHRIEQGFRLNDDQVQTIEVDWMELFKGVFPTVPQLEVLKQGNLLSCRASSYSLHGINNTLLHWAVSANQVEHVDRILNAGIDPNIRGAFGLTALNTALENMYEMKCFSREAFCALLEKVGSPNAPGLGATPSVLFNFISYQKILRNYCSGVEIDQLWNKLDEANANWSMYDFGDEHTGGLPLQAHLVQSAYQWDLKIFEETAKQLLDRGLTFAGRFKINGKLKSYPHFASTIGPEAVKCVTHIQNFEKAKINRKKLQQSTPEPKMIQSRRIRF